MIGAAPIAETVRGLNELQPTILSGYGSLISTLASEQEAGRLRISPVLVTSSAEPLTEKERRRVAGAHSDRSSATPTPHRFSAGRLAGNALLVVDEVIRRQLLR